MIKSYIYCICREGVPLPHGLKGLGDSSLSLISYGGVAAVVSSAPKGACPPTPENVLSHARVVEGILPFSPVIPTRFSSLLGGERQVMDLLRRHCLELRENLCRLEGKVEAGVKVLLPDTPEADRALDTETLTPSPPEAGEEYLLQRQRFYRHRENVAEELRAMGEMLSQHLHPHWEDRRVEYHENPAPMLSACYLLKQETMGAFLKALEALRCERPELKVLFSGPWPPYNFVPSLTRGL